MKTNETYVIKAFDTPIASFEFVAGAAGARARGLEVDHTLTHLLPLNIAAAPTDVELIRFLASRRIPKGRVYLEEILRPFGLTPSDTKGIIDLSRGTSVNDPYSVVPAADNIPYRDYNLFDNDFDEVLQVVAYTGAIPKGALGTGRPSDLTPSGTFPKTWRKIDGKLVLYKAGSAIAAPNYGKEPISEQLAWQVAHAGGWDAVPYALTEWQGKLCSTCELFNTPDTAFVPFELCLPLDTLQLAGFEEGMSYFADISPEAAQAFRDMAVFDYVIANPDRHLGNFGVMRDMHSGSIIGAAPLFDHNVALFARSYDEELTSQDIHVRADASPGLFEATLGWQGAYACSDSTLSKVKRLTNFTFNTDDLLSTCTPTRLKALSTFVRKQAEYLLQSF